MRSEKQNPRRVCWQGHGGEVEVDPEAWTYSAQSVARLPRHAASAGAPETPQSAARRRHHTYVLGVRPGRELSSPSLLPRAE